MDGKPQVEVIVNGQVVPNLDDREYRLIKLENDLEVLLVRDPETDNASAAIDVHIGSQSNPRELLGLAHFCEHLLFMGTKKYPDENEYRKYLESHNGISNAYTASNNTNYYFEVSHDALYGALDRFAQFFIDPLFLEECKDREIRAVDSEHCKNLQSDSWRFWRLYSVLSNPKSVFSKFNTGNIETLGDVPKELGLDVRQELLKFYDKYYSANIMKLVIIGREPLDVLQDWAAELFSPIKNKAVPIPKFPDPPYTDNEVRKICYVKPVKNLRRLDIVFPIPGQYHKYKCRPAEYVCHLLGHEGEGSYLAYLKSLGLATSLIAFNVSITEDADIIVVSTFLTEEGLTDYQRVIKILFEYIRLLDQTNAHKFLFEETRIMSEAQFKTRQKTPAYQYAHVVASKLQREYPRDKVLYYSSVLTEFDPKGIQEVVESLRPNNFFAILAAHSIEKGLDNKEKFYGIDYGLEDLDSQFIDSLLHIKTSSELYLPLANEFIPWSLEVEKQPVTTKLKVPNLVRNDKFVRLWHKKDDTFWVPKANVFINFISPIARRSPKVSVSTTLYTRLIEDALGEYSYPASLAGLSFSLSPSTRGIILCISGFTDKLHVLLEKVVAMMRDLKVHPQRFEILKNRLEQELKDYDALEAYHRSNHVLTWLSEPHSWSNAELREAIKDVQVGDMSDFISDLLKQNFLESLVHGNYTEEDAKNLIESAQKLIDPKPVFASQLSRKRAIIVPEGGNYIYKTVVPNKEEKNSAIMYNLQISQLDDERSGALTRLARQIMKEPTFSILRTKEQLGYIVFTLVRQVTPFINLNIFVQSERSSTYLESRIRALLDQFKSEFLEMSDEDFSKHKSSLINFMLEKHTNLKEESSMYWLRICDGFYDFTRLEKQAEIVSTITKDEFYSFFINNIHYEGENTKKISVHVVSQRCEDEVYEIPNVTIIENGNMFKESMTLSKAAFPLKPFDEIDRSLLFN
ncbi:Metallopeptidase [Schizosaccharomyces pombe]|uniref:Putative zinc protease mug138 n=1 Tax=Schizosaccharomyces pombe (strain 972 / ATCC 24843) TaxID=284812 RepID=MU138_SCHPO|nr:putative metallopeptidase [Schizosaccharomyces pombe]O14077.1 RecName: Full=Putative zinc protease mug138; AltName: Full=Meiotically up-regulated gene 138 protein [Schizosaccharomyces pombe 972h-]CAA20142.1 metallopeptidase (predicted) [Schizosaccharomyces pombe]|eukprot:NP_593966.1 putative metallopeptidase [Schizosaccharomyces pombe]